MNDAPKQVASPRGSRNSYAEAVETESVGPGICSVISRNCAAIFACPGTPHSYAEVEDGLLPGTDAGLYKMMDLTPEQRAKPGATRKIIPYSEGPVIRTKVPEKKDEQGKKSSLKVEQEVLE